MDINKIANSIKSYNNDYNYICINGKNIMLNSNRRIKKSLKKFIEDFK